MSTFINTKMPLDRENERVFEDKLYRGNTILFLIKLIKEVFFAFIIRNFISLSSSNKHHSIKSFEKTSQSFLLDKGNGGSLNRPVRMNLILQVAYPKQYIQQTASGLMDTLCLTYLS